MPYESDKIAKLIRDATNVTRGRLQNTRLTFRQHVQCDINLINHRGEVIETGHTCKQDIDMEILCDGDMYRAMTTTDKTMAEWFNELKDRTATKLFDMSMTKSIYNVEWSIVGEKANISIWFSDSMDGQTNIDAEVIDAILNIIDLKKEWWRMILNRMDRTRMEEF